MKRKTNSHGIISLLLVLDATGVAFISIVHQSLLIAIVFLLLFIGSLLIISVNYCSKCTCRDNCNHLIMGWVSKKLTKEKKGVYTTSDMVLGVVLPFLPTIIIPQFFLYENIVYAILYWVFYGVAIAEIYFFVCKGCMNKKCAMCRQRLNQAMN